MWRVKVAVGNRMISHFFRIAGVMVQTLGSTRWMYGSRRNDTPWMKLIDITGKENSKTGIRIYIRIISTES